MKIWSRRNWRYNTQDINDEIYKFLNKLEGNYICIHPDMIEEKIIELSAYLMTNQINFNKEKYNQFYNEKINIR